MERFYLNFAGKLVSMGRFSHIIFDLDGTLTDPRQGIGNSISYALQKMNINGFGGGIPEGFIGPPLQLGFKHFFSMDDRQTLLAVKYFREYYSTRGLYENEPYEGVVRMLEELHQAGKKIYVATSKLEKFALEICSHFGFKKYITQLKGADYHGEKPKDVLISELLSENHIVPLGDVVMAGDTVFDMEGGKANGILTLAVTYGFGKEPELLNTMPDFIAGSVDEMHRLLLALSEQDLQD
jgi:phosphoglycolate phosphatase